MNKSYHATLCTDAVVNGLTLIKNQKVYIHTNEEPVRILL